MDELLTNKRTAVKYALKQFLKNIMTALSIGVLAISILKIEKIYPILIFVFVFLYIGFQSFKHYKNLHAFLDIKTHISDIGKRSKPEVEVKEMINTNNMMLDRFKMKLDLLKSFSPFPIIVFISGVFINLDIKTNIIPWIVEPTITTKSVYFSIMLLFLIWYGITIMITWDKFITIQFRNLQYQNEYDKILAKDKKEM